MTVQAPLTSTAGTVRPVPRPAPLGRRAAVVCLAVGAVLNLAEALLWRGADQGDTVSENIAAWADNSTLATAALVVGTIAVPFLLLALVAMAQLFRPRMPRLGTSAMVLAFVGGLGFLGIHAVSVVDAAAADQPDRAAMVTLIEDAQSSALAVLILAPFLLGLAGSLLLSVIGYVRTRVVPIWIPVVLAAFLVLDFGGFPIGPVDPHWLFVAAALGVAAVIAGLSDRQWWLGTDATEGREH